ncbi:4Fe-4S binding protein [Chloroflexota bacterium]
MEDAGRSQRPVDLLELPGVGRFLRWRHARSALQLPVFVLSVLMVFDGLTGPQLAPKNLATVFTWVHYRGLVVLALLAVGNLFCMVCPFMLVRNAARRVLGRRDPGRMWPAWLRRKWLAVALFTLMLFAYELFDLWSTPKWTAWVIVGYFTGAVMVDLFFRGASFCKYLCPLGQFNFMSSLVSPFEVCVSEQRVCAGCRTKDCIRGRSSFEATPPPTAGGSREKAQTDRGCELWLFQPRKVGNMDCTFCLDCVRACPHGNVGVASRVPASELWTDARRSGVGRLSRRSDIAVLAVVFTFGALLNAFAMVTPVYALERWLADSLGTQSEAVILALLFLGGLVVLPVLLMTPVAWLTWRLAGRSYRVPFGEWATRHAYALVPLGFGIWLAHYGFHFLTGFWTFVPVLQSFAADVFGLALLGTPMWSLGPLLPMGWLYPLEIGMLGLGWFGSLLVAYHLAAQDERRSLWQTFLPWAALLSVLLAVAIWLMGQPMEMRGTFFVG